MTWRRDRDCVYRRWASAVLHAHPTTEFPRSETDAKDPKDSSQTLSDADISSERILRRRSFLRQTGLLVGGVLAVAAGVRTVRAGDDPDKDGDDPPKSADPPKASDPDKAKKKHKHKVKHADPDAKKAANPDPKKATDPDPH